MAKVITLNEGNQTAFVESTAYASGYFGGVGSGKTYAGIVKGLRHTQQVSTTRTIYGARGLVAASSYPVLEDVVLPQFFEIIEGTGLLLRYEKAKKKAFIKTPMPGVEAEIQFRSVDRPDWIRGRELSWFFIDEGRNVGEHAWKVLVGRLRQKGGYTHQGWVCSTPNGHDWMFRKFHEDSEDHKPGYVWFGAPTYDNAKNLPADYLENLTTDYVEGSNFYLQEIMGQFVGTVEGAVFTDWRPQTQVTKVDYDSDKALYSFWDFGMGDLGVCVFAQMSKVERIRRSPLTQVPDIKVLLDELRILGVLAAKDWSSARWAYEFETYRQTYFGGRMPARNIGDPAGNQRQFTGTSVITDLNAAGVPIESAPRRPRDYGLRLLYNMTADNRLWVDKEKANEVGRALGSYKWQVDSSGQRVGSEPVHDWTSHYCDAIRYGVTALGDLYAEPEPQAPTDEPPPGTWDNLLAQIANEEQTEFYIGHDGPVSGRHIALPIVVRSK